MGIRTQSAWIGAVCAWFALGAAESHACSCEKRSTVDERSAVQEAFKNVDAVFFGRVTSQIVIDDERRFEFEVLTSWKGVTTPTIMLTTAKSCASCGIVPYDGDELLVYARIDGSTGGLRTNSCTRTGDYGAPLEDVEVFQALGFDPIVRYSEEPPLDREDPEIFGSPVVPFPCGLGMTFGIASCTFALVAVGGIRRIGRSSRTHG